MKVKERDERLRMRLNGEGVRGDGNKGEYRENQDREIPQNRGSVRCQEST